MGFDRTPHYPQSFFFTVIKIKNTLSSKNITFSYLVFLRNFLFGHRAKDSNLDLPLIVGPCYHYTTLLIPAILLLSCTDSNVISCTHGILNMALYSLLNYYIW